MEELGIPGKEGGSETWRPFAGRTLTGTCWWGWDPESWGEVTLEHVSEHLTFPGGLPSLLQLSTTVWLRESWGCVSMYACPCVCLQVSTCVHTCPLVWVCLHVCTRDSMRVSVCLLVCHCVYMCQCMYDYPYMWVHMYPCVSICMCLYVSVCVCPRVCPLCVDGWGSSVRTHREVAEAARSLGTAPGSPLRFRPESHLTDVRDVGRWRGNRRCRENKLIWGAHHHREWITVRCGTPAAC